MSCRDASKAPLNKSMKFVMSVWAQYPVLNIKESNGRDTRQVGLTSSGIRIAISGSSFALASRDMEPWSSSTEYDGYKIKNMSER